MSFSPSIPNFAPSVQLAPDVVAFLRAHPPPVPLPVCPLAAGVHIWVWPGGHSEGWKTARFQIDRAHRLGARGVIVQSGLFAPQWLEGRDPGESLTRIELIRAAGLQATAGFGLDGHHPLQEVIGALVHAVLVADAGMLDHEAASLWENLPGRAYARAIVEGVLDALAKLSGLAPDEMQRVARALAGGHFADADWWEPICHLSAPTLIFWILAIWKFVQAYGAPAQGNPVEDTEWMYERAARDYPKLGIAAEVVGPSEQMYGHTLKNAGRLLFCGHPVLCLWDVEEMDHVFEAAMLARAAISARYNVLTPTAAHLVQFERDHGLTVDAGDLGPEILRALNIPLPQAA